MCLAVPGKITAILNEKAAMVEFMGIKKKVATDILEEVKIGEYVIVHAGFAINKLDKKEALETIEALKELYETSRQL